MIIINKEINIELIKYIENYNWEDLGTWDHRAIGHNNSSVQ